MPQSSLTRGFPTRRKVLAAAAAAPLALQSRAQSNRGASDPGAKPNIVYIMADDLGYADLSCYGRREYKTPNIDRSPRTAPASRRPMPIRRCAPPRARR